MPNRIDRRSVSGPPVTSESQKPTAASKKEPPTTTRAPDDANDSFSKTPGAQASGAPRTDSALLAAVSDPGTENPIARALPHLLDIAQGRATVPESSYNALHNMKSLQVGGGDQSTLPDTVTAEDLASVVRNWSAPAV